MSDHIVVLYSSEARAEAGRRRLFELREDVWLEVRDAAIGVKTAKGRVKLNQLVNSPAICAACGALWGLLVGAMFAEPAVGAPFGAALGLIGGILFDYGINDRFMMDLSQNLQPGHAALFVLLPQIAADDMLDDLKRTGGTVLRISPGQFNKKALHDAFAAAAARPAVEKAAG
jgi:uncharacterized membrane protein